MKKIALALAFLLPSLAANAMSLDEAVEIADGLAFELSMCEHADTCEVMLDGSMDSKLEELLEFEQHNYPERHSDVVIWSEAKESLFFELDRVVGAQ